MNALQKQIIKDIRKHGPLPFIDFMETALYADDHGYYTSDRAVFGADGDFITAPELAPPDQISLFAGSLARHLAQAHAALCRQTLIEVGAGSGRLAVDLLRALQQLDCLPAEYILIERSQIMQQRQQALLEAAGLLDRVRWQDLPPEQDWNGILIANELLDALPVERFRVYPDRIARLAVDVASDDDNKDQLVWAELPADAELSAQVKALRKQLDADQVAEWPLPYTSEICPDLPDLLAALTGKLNTGMLLLIDYGYLQHEYYHPQRHMGTLVSHHGHRGHFDLLSRPGEQDLSAFVDFSAVLRAAESCGLQALSFQTQAEFLLNAGIDTLLAPSHAGNDNKAMLRRNAEFKQLMLPTEMGEKFKVLSLGKSLRS
jgi:SAM-dependent MidA family methyltransferase